MTFKTLIYPLLIIFCIFMIYANEKKRRQYKKENINVLFSLNEDDKLMRLISSLMLVFMIISSAITIIDVAATKGIFSADALFILLLPVTLIILYLPLSKKSKITTLGIFKRSNLIRWEDIKGIDYLKPDSKGKYRVRILYKGPYKDIMQVITFKKEDEQLELFKNAAKEYRNNKKDKNRDKKSGQ